MSDSRSPDAGRDEPLDMAIAGAVAGVITGAIAGVISGPIARVIAGAAFERSPAA